MTKMNDRIHGIDRWAKGVIATHLLTPSDRIFVGVPRIAQSRIDKAQLTVQGITLSQAQTDNFTMSINSTIRADSSIGATIDAFDAVMYLEDWPPQTPYARVSFPETTSASETIVNLTQFTEILDENAFTTFNTWFLHNETLNLSVEGDTHLKVSGISKKWPVHFKKTVNITALNNFKGMTVPESRISLSSDSQGDNFFGTVTIPNESIIGFELVSREAFTSPLCISLLFPLPHSSQVSFPGWHPSKLKG